MHCEVSCVHDADEIDFHSQSAGFRGKAFGELFLYVVEFETFADTLDSIGLSDLVL